MLLLPRVWAASLRRQVSHTPRWLMLIIIIIITIIVIIILSPQAIVSQSLSCRGRLGSTHAFYGTS